MKMRRLVSFVLSTSTLLAILCVSQVASAADPVAGLRFDTGAEMDANVVSAVEAAVSEAFGSVDRWSLIPFDDARSKLDAQTRDCFTSDCLTSAGTTVGAPAGISVEISGEAQIYNWTVQLWDLRTGEKLNEQKGNCELCGRAEVKRTFRESVKALLIGTSLPSAAEAKGTKTDTGTTEPGDGEVAVRISVVPKDANILVGGNKIGEGDVTEALGPGEHQIRFKREGYQGFNETLIVNENTRGPILLRVHMSRTDPETVEVGGSTGPIDRLGKGKRTLYGGIATGAGVILLGTGIYLESIDGEPTCDDRPASQCPEVYATGGAAMTTGILGGVALTGGVTLLIWEALAGSSSDDSDDSESQPEPSETPDDDSSEGEPSVSLSPSVAPMGAGGGTGVVIHGRF